MYLYHGSRGGIEGEIVARSRMRCDFGSGFYMSDDWEQAKSVVATDYAPFLYSLDFKIEEIPESEILRLSGLEWLFFVLFNRVKLEKFIDLNYDLYSYISNLANDKSLIIGPLADDVENIFIEKFVSGEISDRTFLNCLNNHPHGMQYVAIKKSSCRNIQVLKEEKLSTSDAAESLRKLIYKKEKAEAVANSYIKKYEQSGLSFSEVVENFVSCSSPFLRIFFLNKEGTKKMKEIDRLPGKVIENDNERE